MTSNYDEMLYDSSQNRSPNNLGGGYSAFGLHRQPSRQFQPYGAATQPSNMYAQEDDLPASYDTARSDRQLPSGYATYNQHSQYESQIWNQGANGYNAATMGASSRLRPANRRAGIPTNWTEPQPQATSYGQMPPMHQNHLNDQSSLHGLPNGHANGFSNGYSPLQQPLQHEASSNEGESAEDLIPTAIVIKNIPFAIKREQLADMMANLGLPAPYAFNYHFDNGVFRGLAFANFTNPAETKIVIDAMNHMDLAGRKLRVEYKKMLPAAERERIEREKRHRRGQLEEQHRPTGSLNHQASMNSLSSHPPRPTQSPSPVSARGPTPGAIDMNDPYTLQMYGDMIAFKHNPDRQVLTFGPALTSVQRRIAHELAQKAGLFHDSVGPDDRRSVQISKQKFTPVMPADLNSTTQQLNDGRRGLSRAATTDFSESRDAFHGLRSQQSGLLDIPHEPSAHAAQSLRGAKSFGDLQTRMPSPANSLGNFPIGLASNVSRYQAYTNGNGSVASLTPTARTGANDDYISSFANMGINSNYSGVSRFGSRLDNPGAVNGAIGSQRSITNLNGTHEDTPRQASSLVDRQPRGPSSQSQGFQRRNNGHVQRRSADLDPQEGEESGSRFH